MWGGFGLGPLTLALMGACIGLALVAGFPPERATWRMNPLHTSR